MSAPGSWSKVVALAGRREPATGLAVLRIGLGMTVLLTIAGIVRHGLVDLLFVDAAHGGYRTLPETWQAGLFGGATPTVAWSLIALVVVAATCLTAGLGGRISAALTLFAYDGLTDLNQHAGGSYDELIDNGLWILVLAPATTTLSLDCWRRTGRWRDRTEVPAWTRYVAVYQVVLMYFTSGIQKVSAAWIPGGEHSALFYILQWPAWRRFDPSWLGWAYPATQVATLGTWCFEVLSPIWLLALWWHATRDRGGTLRRWSNRLRLRWWFWCFGIALHLSTWILLELGPFAPAALSFYACLLAPDDFERRTGGTRVRQ